MEYRAFGNTGLQVSALGFGAGHIGGDGQDAAAIEYLIHALVDAGVTLFDTAKGYHHSEQRLGQALRGKRDQVVISTKVGYGIPGYADWTGPCITAGIDAALQALHTDYLDIVHLHSCPVGTLAYGEVIAALHAAQQAGKIRVAAYSGENEALDWAVQSGAFGSVQCSVNVADQASLRDRLPGAVARGLGVIAKRPLANAPWRFASQPHGDYAEAYWLRLQAMNVPDFGIPWPELALRFTAYSPGVHTAIVGSHNWAHLQANLAACAQGPLPPAVYAQIRSAFDQADAGWAGEI
jgi:aryl-alcohol dehydrogenase-like predicted oxidoreductase